MRHPKHILVAAWSLSIPSWIGFAAMLFVIATAMAQWDDNMLRPFEFAGVFGTLVCGSISVILAAYLMWTQRRWILFCWCVLPVAAVATVTVLARFLK
jgi:hypothetical protein